MSDFTRPNLEGQTLGKYQVIKEIGRGSMGTVYLGHDPFIDRPVAIKVAPQLPPELNADPDMYRRIFFNEAHTAGLLKHPNITAIFDAGSEGSTYYIVMEYVHGGRTLDWYCRPENLLPIKDVLSVVFACASALEFAHRKGVIHRDVKPRNILVTADRQVKLTDFGIAVMQDATGAVLQAGSPLYMAPEQVRHEPATTQTDLFALGVVLYESLTGAHPFAGSNLDAINHKILNVKPAPIATLRAEAPAMLQRVVDRALAKDPAQRYRSAIDMAGDLTLGFDFLRSDDITLTQQEKFDSARALRFFAQFNDAEIWELINASAWQRLHDGRTIVTEGELDKSFYIIVAGAVEVRKSGQFVDLLRTGDCFGEMGYVSGRPRSATITARGDVTVMKLQAPLVERASLTTQLRFHKLFLNALVERLERATERIATGRVAGEDDVRNA
ncbi:MAG: serine/threonine-protein kinase [Gammaproteobacteria bacterium]